jgi:glycerophosphoryl diester phosphodiesterase
MNNTGMRNTGTLISLILGLLMSSQTHAQAADKIVIAHRGASGYLPEHTLEAKAMAYAMGADYIEQDLVMTADDQLIVLHDITLDRTTDVAERFPGRARADGRYYAIDFSLAEVRQLQATEGFDIENGERVQGFRDRFPMGQSSFRVPTFQEEIELIQGLNQSTGRDIGIYPEIKQAAFHRAEGKDISSAVVNVLKQYGYTSKDSRVFLQSFEFEELETIKQEILPAAGIEVRLIQLIGSADSYPWMFEADGMERLSSWVDGIGPSYNLVIERQSSAEDIRITPLVQRAHAAGLQVHPYTYRADNGVVPAYAGSFDRLLELHYIDADVDGVFTDFPDKAVQFLSGRR